MEKSQAFQLFKDGKTANDLVKAGVPKSNAYGWQRAYAKDNPPEVTTVEEARPIANVAEKKVDATKVKKKPVTEETAGMLLAMGFGIWGSLAREPLWYLTDAQREMLATPFAETLKSIPGPIADGINSYAPPLAFAGALMAVVSEKQSQIRERADANVIRPERFRVVEGTAAPATREPVASDPDADVPVDRRESSGTPEPPLASIFERST